MRICNACRYCQGFCAVFPAMALRRTLSEQELKYLANLCHDCRGCYYACQYAPPHEFALNLPKALGDLRLETYREFCWPPALKNLFDPISLTTAMIALPGIFITTLLVWLFQDQAVFFGSHLGAGAFYQVIPYPMMVLPFSALGIFVLYSLGKGMAIFYRGTGGNLKDLLNPRANLRTIGDVLRMKYLDGGGPGCNYPGERFTMIRRYFHHAVFYGFALCLAATTLAFFYHHFLGRPAPYPFWSWPVIPGTLGGLAILTGTGGLLFLKIRMDRIPAGCESLGLDLSFLIFLFLISLTGFVLFLFRSTSVMGILLALHLGVVAVFFVTLPYSKFVHGVYRYAALIRHAVEQSRKS
jgi:citrate/tricarballylate utilization protein